MKRLIFSRGRKQDPLEQKRLFDRYYETVYRVAFRYCQNRQDALDIVQEAFVRAFSYRTTFNDQGEQSFTAWLKAITRNEALRYIKQRAKRKETFVDDWQWKAVDSFKGFKEQEPQEQTMRRMQLDCIRNIIAELPEHYRQILTLKIVHHFSHKQIGKTLNIDENTSRQRFHRAKEAVKKQYRKEWGLEHDE
ncbi:MAG TPA: RNA polymerase sigma factor [Bacillales bacterium]|nr:RNA polymerase sigma factor [Bacillales bacterium]